jgi:hypothetical protein
MERDGWGNIIERDKYIAKTVDLMPDRFPKHLLYAITDMDFCLFFSLHSFIIFGHFIPVPICDGLP